MQETPRKSVDVLTQLLSVLHTTVTHYHPDVTPTPSTLDGLIAGTTFFPGGSGLWRGAEPGGALPELFPEEPVMFVGHNFNSQRAFERTFARRGEADVLFWRNLRAMMHVAGLGPEQCFFTNALMGLKPGSSLGPMPAVPGYREQCARFLQQQTDIVQPRAMIALGVNAAKYVDQLALPSLHLLHPSHRDFGPLLTRQARLREEGEQLREFLGILRPLDTSFATENTL